MGGAVFLARRTYADAKKDRVPGLAAEVAFYALLSLPPMLLAVFASVGFVARSLGEEATARIETAILDASSTFLTPDAVDQLGPVIDSFLSEGRAGLAVVGLAVALWSASRATRVFIDAVSLAYDLPEERSAVRRRLRALGVTALGVLGAVVVLPLLVAGPRLGAWVGRPLGLGDAFAATWRVLYWPSVGLLVIVLLVCFYHFAPSWSTPWRRDIPGAVLATVIWVAGGVGLRIYAAVSIEGNSVYGGLAAPIVILLWLWLTGIAVLLGAELNAEIEKAWPTTGYTEAKPSR